MSRIAMLCDFLLLLLSLMAALLVVYNLGFPTSPSTQVTLGGAYRTLLVIEWFAFSVLGLTQIITRRLGPQTTQQGALLGPKERRQRVVRLGLYCLLTLIVGMVVVNHALTSNHWIVALGVSVVSVMVVSRWVTSILGRRTSPPMILASSFGVIIVLGALLFLLPKATLPGVDISFIDSLFVSTSAVCVTGLSTVDVATTFSTTGQVILLFLIQIGGLGVMTITSFFGLFFSSGRKFSGQMVVGDLLSTSRLSELVRVLLSIVIVTVGIELIGAIFLYGSIMQGGELSSTEGWFFAIFHSISAFCNAGFSTLSGNLADPTLTSLNTMRYVVGVLIVFGGIGFPIFMDLIHAVRDFGRNIWRQVWGRRKRIYPRVWRLNTYIVVRMTVVLVLGSWAIFMLLEWDASLGGMTTAQKISQSFLMAISPRTAGFNGVDMQGLLPASILLTTVLMWIGGAPQSTAGGIKLTTAYVALKNIIASNRGGGDITVRYRTIPKTSGHRAFAVISLSIVIISLSTLVLSVLNPLTSLGDLVFEVVSAISTVGLSMGITAELTTGSKYIIIGLMFVGRVGLISMLVLFYRQSSLRAKPYTYPTEDILIN